MKKQLLKGFTTLLAIMTLAMVTAVASVNGQSQKSKAKIPFEFVVGDQTMPAGAYTADSMTAAGDVLRIRAIDSNDTVLRLTTPASGSAEHAKLVFHRYGDRYFLAEVWTTNEDGRALLKSKQERAIQKENSRIASGKPASRAYETVEVALAAQ